MVSEVKRLLELPRVPMSTDLYKNVSKSKPTSIYITSVHTDAQNRLLDLAQGFIKYKTLTMLRAKSNYKSSVIKSIILISMVIGTIGTLHRHIFKLIVWIYDNFLEFSKFFKFCDVCAKFLDTFVKECNSNIFVFLEKNWNKNLNLFDKLNDGIDIALSWLENSVSWIAVAINDAITNCIDIACSFFINLDTLFQGKTLDKIITFITPSIFTIMSTQNQRVINDNVESDVSEEHRGAINLADEQNNIPSDIAHNSFVYYESKIPEKFSMRSVHTGNVYTDYNYKEFTNYGDGKVTDEDLNTPLTDEQLTNLEKSESNKPEIVTYMCNPSAISDDRPIYNTIPENNGYLNSLLQFNSYTGNITPDIGKYHEKLSNLGSNAIDSNDAAANKKAKILAEADDIIFSGNYTQLFSKEKDLLANYVTTIHTLQEEARYNKHLYTTRLYDYNNGALTSQFNMLEMVKNCLYLLSYNSSNILQLLQSTRSVYSRDELFDLYMNNYTVDDNGKYSFLVSQENTHKNEIIKRILESLSQRIYTTYNILYKLMKMNVFEYYSDILLQETEDIIREVGGNDAKSFTHLVNVDSESKQYIYEKPIIADEALREVRIYTQKADNFGFEYDVPTDKVEATFPTYTIKKMNTVK